MAPSIPDRIRVFTITITAPQHAQRIGARCLTQASAGAGANLSSRCSKAISRLQLGCKKPKLRARRKAYRKNAIPPQLWPDLTGAIFAEVQHAVSGWAAGRDDLHCVPTTGTLVAADPDATGSSGDWLNEIHPNAAGWEKLAGVWQQTIRQVLT